MSVSNGVITGDIDVSDPYVVTGAPKYAGGYTAGAGAFRAMVPYINKWAPNKPMGNIFAPIDVPFGALTQAQKAACYYGLTPPLNSNFLQAADINSFPEWTEAGWTYDLSAEYARYDRLNDWAGYDHGAFAPCVVKVASMDSYCAEDPVTVTLEIPKAVAGKVIPITDLGVGDRYLCLLLRQAGESDRWAMVTSEMTIGSLYGGGAGGQVSIAVDGSRLNEIRAGWSGATQFEWWVCASSAKCATLTAKSAAELNDAGGITFAALPADNTGDFHGMTEYEYRDYFMQYMQVTLWGISWKAYWYAGDGLFPIAQAVNSGIQCGQMVGDYLYGLQVGFTITNTAPSSVSVRLNMSGLNPILVASVNFAGNSAGMNYSPYKLKPSVVLSDVSLTRVTSAATGTALQVYSGASTELAPGQSAHFVASHDTLLSAPLISTAVVAGQTIRPQIIAGMGNYSGEAEVIARN